MVSHSETGICFKTTQNIIYILLKATQICGLSVPVNLQRSTKTSGNIDRVFHARYNNKQCESQALGVNSVQGGVQKKTENQKKTFPCILERTLQHAHCKTTLSLVFVCLFCFCFIFAKQEITLPHTSVISITVLFLFQSYLSSSVFRMVPHHQTED